MKDLYTEEDLKAYSYQETIPGQAPYTRGPYSSMYTKQPWTIRQYAGFSTPEESNAFYRKALASGQKGLSIAFDLPTHRGYDSDHPKVAHDVGKSGVAIDSVEDMHILFSHIPLDQMSVSMTMNGAVLPILAAYIVAAEESGVSREKLQGTIQNDILKEYMVRNTYIYPPKPSMRITGDVIAFTSKHMPLYHPMSISGYHIQEAGAESALELAYTLANGLEYVKTALDYGLLIDDFAPRLSFFFGMGMNFFLEIAKLRAARTLWHELLTPFKPKNPKSLILKTHCQTSGYTLTEQDPYNNIVRTTVEAMAAILGGTQSLHTNSFDEAMALPSDLSARVARNTQLILQLETDITHTVDPFGGSYMMESLTQELIQKARSLIQEVQDQGGMVYAIENGLAKRRIEESAAKKQARIDKGEQKIVGVNCFQVLNGENTIPVRQIDHDHVYQSQLEKLKALKQKRNAQAVQESLIRLKDGARDKKNLIDLTIDAIRARATLGEVSFALEEIFGRYDAPMNLAQHIYGREMGQDQDFQKARETVRGFEKTYGRKPRILVVKLGQDGHDRGIKVIATGLSDCGFDVDIGHLFQTPEEAAKQAIENDVHIIGVSSQAGAHKELIYALKQALKAQGGDHISLVLGGVVPEQDYASLKEQGVGLIFGPGSKITDCAISLIELVAQGMQ